MDILIPFFSALSMYLIMAIMIFSVQTVGKDCRKFMYRMFRINRKRILSKSFKWSVVVFFVLLLFLLGLKYAEIYFCVDECVIPDREPQIMRFFGVWCISMCGFLIFNLLMVKSAVKFHKKRDLEKSALQ